MYLRFLPKWVMKVGVEGFIRAVTTEDGDDVRTRESTAASESEYGCKLFGQKKHIY